MPKFDRGIIKWMPFDSVMSSKKMVNDLIKEKSKCEKPSLDEEQIKKIENTLIEAFYENRVLSLDYFYDGNIYHINSNIKKIDSIYHKIYFSNKIILFEQIIKIY